VDFPLYGLWFCSSVKAQLSSVVLFLGSLCCLSILLPAPQSRLVWLYSIAWS
jgi:hypothetical protein